MSNPISSHNDPIRDALIQLPNKQAPSSVSQVNAYPAHQIPSAPPISIQQVPPTEIQSKELMYLTAMDRLDQIKNGAVFIFHMTHEPVKVTLDNVAPQVEGMEFGLNFAELAIAVPKIAFNTYSLAKNWKKTSVGKKLLSGASILNTHLFVAGSMTQIIHLAPGVSEIAAAGAAKASSLLGPLGLGLASVLLSIKGTISAVKAHHAGKRFEAAGRILEKLKEDNLLKKFITREKVRFLGIKRFEAFSSFQSFLLAAGLGAAAIASALIAAGIVAAAVSTPVGWALLGIMLAGTLVALGVYAYRRYQAKQMAELEQTGVAQDLATKIQIPDRLQLIKAELKKYFNKEEASILVTDAILKKVLEPDISKIANFHYVFNETEHAHLQSLIHTFGGPISLPDKLTVGQFKGIVSEYAQNLQEEQKWLNQIQRLLKSDIDALNQEAATLVAPQIEALLIQELSILKKDFTIDLEVLTNKKESQTIDEAIGAYARKVATSSIWPKSPTLAQRVASLITLD